MRSLVPQAKVIGREMIPPPAVRMAEVELVQPQPVMMGCDSEMMHSSSAVRMDEVEVRITVLGGTEQILRVKANASAKNLGRFLERKIFDTRVFDDELGKASWKEAADLTLADAMNRPRRVLFFLSNAQEFRPSPTDTDSLQDLAPDGVLYLTVVKINSTEAAAPGQLHMDNFKPNPGDREEASLYLIRWARIALRDKRTPWRYIRDVDLCGTILCLCATTAVITGNPCHAPAAAVSCCSSGSMTTCPQGAVALCQPLASHPAAAATGCAAWGVCTAFRSGMIPGLFTDEDQLWEMGRLKALVAESMPEGSSELEIQEKVRSLTSGVGWFGDCALNCGGWCCDYRPEDSDAGEMERLRWIAQGIAKGQSIAMGEDLVSMSAKLVSLLKPEEEVLGETAV